MRLMRSPDKSQRNSNRALDQGELVDLRCSALILRRDSVLLCHKTDEDVWVLPGGTPKASEGTASAAEREIAEETGLSISAGHIAFVLETTSRDASHHLIEIVFLGLEANVSAVPEQREEGLIPSFASLEDLGDLKLRPPISGYIRGFARYQRITGDDRRLYTAAYLGNLWREPDPAR